MRDHPSPVPSPVPALAQVYIGGTYAGEAPVESWTIHDGGGDRTYRGVVYLHAIVGRRCLQALSHEPDGRLVAHLKAGVEVPDLVTRQ